MADDPGTGRVPLRQFAPLEGEGLHGKYIVHKTDTGEIVRTPCFVLRYDRDPHARAALRAYAASCEPENPRLAFDLEQELRRLHAAVESTAALRTEGQR